MEARIPPHSLKAFTTSIRCLARYGDDVFLDANVKHLSLSCLNSTSTAYCRVRFHEGFFGSSKSNGGGSYMVGNGKVQGHVHGGATSTKQPASADVEDLELIESDGDSEVEVIPFAYAQLSVKSLVSVLRYASSDKGIEKCQLCLVQGGSTIDGEKSLESTLMFVAQYKHGIRKVHRLSTQVPAQIGSPALPPNLDEVSEIKMSSASVRELLEHFASPAGEPTTGKRKAGMKDDLYLVWEFGEHEVKVSTQNKWKADSSRSKRAEPNHTDRDLLKNSLSTTIELNTEDFELYELVKLPIKLSFPLREFNAAVALAETIGESLTLRFTEPRAPIFIQSFSDSEFIEVFGAIATQSIDDDQSTASRPERIVKSMPKTTNQTFKRERETVSATNEERAKRQRTMPPPSLHIIPKDDGPSFANISSSTALRNHPLTQPLFFPPTQMTQADVDAIQAAGLGDIGDFNEILDDDLDEELRAADEADAQTRNLAALGDDNEEGLEMTMEDDTEQLFMDATQSHDSAAFRRIFDD